ncbi:MAG: hypothetical protein EOP82_23995 [Variovorax sp.]|nr:MAG: hypothetical protein EOP82_23995 [Variovorax sp.]
MGKFQLFSGKMNPPLAVALPIDRSALIDDVLESSPAGVILVFAAGGYGKTTLLTQLFASLNAAGVPTGWVTLSGIENELERFVTYLSAAVKRIEGAAAPGVTAEQMLAGSSGEPLADAMALLERMAAQGGPYALFLDDFQEITNPDVLALVTELIALLGPGQRLIVGSRFLPELGVPRLRAQGRLQEVNAQRLSFNLEETRLFLRRHRAGDLSDADLRLLFERTEGWPAALQLAALALSAEGDSTAFIRRLRGTTVEIVDYLAHDVYASMHPELRSFLLDISVLESFCAQLCDAVGERADSQEMIDRVRRSGLFLSPLAAADPWCRLHQLFREFLFGQLQREAPGRSALLHGRAARWYAAQDRPLYAVNHALHAGEQALAAELMSAVSREFLHQGRTATLTHWSDVLAPEILIRHPVLLEDCTVAHIARHAHGRGATDQHDRAGRARGRDHRPGQHSARRARHLDRSARHTGAAAGKGARQSAGHRGAAAHIAAQYPGLRASAA